MRQIKTNVSISGIINLMSTVPAPGTTKASYKQSVSRIYAPDSRPDLLKIIRLKRALVEKHLTRYELDPVTGCHLWTGPTSSNREGEQYSRVSFKYAGCHSKVAGHRLSYAYHHGVDPGDLFVCHRCDVPLCINPEHLFLGTTTDNMQDMHAKGRAANQSGTNNPRCKVTLNDIDLIVELLPKLNNIQIASRLDNKIGHSMVSRIRLGKSWSDYTGIEAQS